MALAFSNATPQSAGLPNSVAKTKQALARGYAVVAVSSRDRSREGRCFGMKDDAAAVVEVISTVRCCPQPVMLRWMWGMIRPRWSRSFPRWAAVCSLT